MELVRGHTLQHRMDSGPMSPRFAMRVAAEVAAALAAAHADGLVHRDIKPANVMVTETGAKVVDFGIAAAINPAGTGEEEFEVLGTPAYLAPERLIGDGVEPASDVYALGVLLYRMLSGQSPWSADTTTQMLTAHIYVDPEPLPPSPGVPDYITALCNRCLSKDPTQRPSAREAAALLAQGAGLRVVQDALPAGPAGPSHDHEPSVLIRPRPARSLRPPSWYEDPTLTGPTPDPPAGSTPVPSAGSGPVSPAGSGAVPPAGPGPVRPAAYAPGSGPAPGRRAGSTPGATAEGPGGPVFAAGVASSADGDRTTASSAVGASRTGAGGASQAGAGGTSQAGAGGTSQAGAGGTAQAGAGHALVAGASGASASDPAAAAGAGRAASRRRRHRTMISLMAVVFLLAAGGLLWWLIPTDDDDNGRGQAAPAPVVSGASASAAPSASPPGAKRSGSAIARPRAPGVAATSDRPAPGDPPPADDDQPTTTTTTTTPPAGEDEDEEPAPTTTAPTTDPPAQERTLSSSAGSVRATCAGPSTAQLLSWSATKPYKVNEVDEGPAASPAVVFKHGNRLVRMTVTCSGGVPSGSTDEG
jgi:serine/threonine-protein kinase